MYHWNISELGVQELANRKWYPGETIYDETAIKILKYLNANEDVFKYEILRDVNAPRQIIESVLKSMQYDPALGQKYQRGETQLVELDTEIGRGISSPRYVSDYAQGKTGGGFEPDNLPSEIKHEFEEPNPN